MRRELVLARERSSADTTRERPLAGVHSPVSRQVGRVREPLGTLVARVRLLAGVRSPVLVEVARVPELLVAKLALELTASSPPPLLPPVRPVVAGGVWNRLVRLSLALQHRVRRFPGSNCRRGWCGVADRRRVHVVVGARLLPGDRRAAARDRPLRVGIFGAADPPGDDPLDRQAQTGLREVVLDLADTSGANCVQNLDTEASVFYVPMRGRWSGAGGRNAREFLDRLTGRLFLNSSPDVANGHLLLSVRYFLWL